jgi:acetyl esterase/lipase
MPSLKYHLVAFVLRHTRKKAFASPEALHARIGKMRSREDHRPPAKVAARLDITERKVGNFPVYEAKPKGTTTTRRLLYIHGGAFCFEMTPHHWNLIAELAERTAAHVTVPIYPLAPEHQLPAVEAMMTEVYRDALGQGGDVTVMGDSAGGTMALALTMMAAKQGWPLPSRLVLISPGLDMTLANPKVRDYARVDPWLDIPGGTEAMRLYGGDIPLDDWRISPLHGDLSVLPPVLAFSGTHDILYPDTVLFTERARALGRQVDLVTGERMFHVWPLIDMPEAKAARDRMVAFLSS